MASDGRNGKCRTGIFGTIIGRVANAAKENALESHCMSLSVSVYLCLSGAVGPVIVSAASDETVAEGQSVTLSCQTSAVPPVAVVWRHNAQPVHANHRIRITGMHYPYRTPIPLGVRRLKNVYSCSSW